MSAGQTEEALVLKSGCQQVSLGRAISELKARGFVKGGQQIAIVQSGRLPIWRSSSTHAIQVASQGRPFPRKKPYAFPCLQQFLYT